MLHLAPWDVEDRMSVEQFDTLEQYLENRAAEIRKVRAENGGT